MKPSTLYWLYLAGCIALAALVEWHERERARAEATLVRTVHAHVYHLDRGR